MYIGLVPIVYWICFFAWRSPIKTSIPYLFLTVASVSINLMYSTYLLYDTKYIHGEVTKKYVDKDSYLETYSCNTRTICTNGNCSTTSDICTRTVYTVDWLLSTTVGKVNLKSLSSYSPSIHWTKDPDIFVKALIGEKATVEKPFKNYIKRSEFSLFKKSDSSNSYPEIFSKYKYQNVYSYGVPIDTKLYQDEIDLAIKKLKRVNLILIFTNKGETFYTDLLKAYGGARINDVIVVIGANDNKINWVRSFTYANSLNNSLLVSYFETELQSLDLDAKAIVQIITSNLKTFNEVSEDQFSYLQAPSNWWLTLLHVVLSLLACIFVNLKWSKK